MMEWKRNNLPKAEHSLFLIGLEDPIGVKKNTGLVPID